MAVIKRGILGGFQNKIANVVGSSWKGIATMRSLPISVANPRTVAQTAQRDKFSQATKFASLLLPSIIKPLWDRFAQRESGYNAFVRTNIQWFNPGSQPSLVNALISKGIIEPTGGITAAVDRNTGLLTVNWPTNTVGQQSPFDIAFIAYADANGEVAEGFNTGVQRGAGTVTVQATKQLPFAGVIWVWLAFKSLDGTKVSNSEITNV